MQPLDASGRAWVDLQKALMHRHTGQAIDASNRWNELNAELMAKFRAEGRSDLEIARIKAVNLPLGDAYSAYQFHAGKAQLHAAVLQAELAARQLLVVDADPTGLGYSRTDDDADDLVPPPLPDGVDGLSITGRPRRPHNAPTGPAHPGTPNSQFSTRSGSSVPAADGLGAAAGTGGAAVGAAVPPTRGGAAA